MSLELVEIIKGESYMKKVLEDAYASEGRRIPAEGVKYIGINPMSNYERVNRRATYRLINNPRHTIFKISDGLTEFVGNYAEVYSVWEMYYTHYHTLDRLTLQESVNKVRNTDIYQTQETDSYPELLYKQRMIDLYPRV